MPLIGNLFSACFCLGCSATYHLMQVKSVGLSTILARLDYGGISVLIMGTIYSVIHYAFACDESYNWYLGFTIGMSMGTCFCFICTLVPDCDKAKCRPAKGTMFIAMGLATASVLGTLGVPNEY